MWLPRRPFGRSRRLVVNPYPENRSGLPSAGPQGQEKSAAVPDRACPQFPAKCLTPDHHRPTSDALPHTFCARTWRAVIAAASERDQHVITRELWSGPAQLRHQALGPVTCPQACHVGSGSTAARRHQHCATWPLVTCASAAVHATWAFVTCVSATAPCHVASRHVGFSCSKFAGSYQACVRRRSSA